MNNLLTKKLKTNKNEITVKNNNKSNNTTVGVAYHATRNAITLIALVITIIVLLILAGVTINLVLGPEGLLKQAQDATDKYKQAENEELNSMSNILAQLESINKGNGGGTDNPEKPVDPSTAKPGEIIKTENNIKYTSDGEGNIIPVPEGFSYTGEGTKESGFVIRNDEDKNEFVWIPTDLVEYKTYNWNKGAPTTEHTEYYTSDATENTRIIEEITKSVNDNKGYYISRYEAGVTTKRTSKTETNQSELPNPIFRVTSTTTPVYAYNYVTWDDAIYIGNNLYNKTTNNVTSRLINARGWDTALKFIETVGEDKDTVYPTNSTGKGWHKNNNLNNVDYEIGKSVDLTNATVPNRVKNIYDMAGNVYEWTADINTSATSWRLERRWRLLLFWFRASSSSPLQPSLRPCEPRNWHTCCTLFVDLTTKQ